MSRGSVKACRLSVKEFECLYKGSDRSLIGLETMLSTLGRLSSFVSVKGRGCDEWHMLCKAMLYAVLRKEIGAVRRDRCCLISPYAVCC